MASLDWIWNTHAPKPGDESKEIPLQVCDSSPTSESRYQVVANGILKRLKQVTDITDSL